MTDNDATPLKQTLVLPDALHARPADVLVRTARGFTAKIELRAGTKRADAKKVLQVLALGAAKGSSLEIETQGDDARAALDAITSLIARSFDAAPAATPIATSADGIAIGRALVERTHAPSTASTLDRTRLTAAFAEARQRLEARIASLPSKDAALFIPERAILDELETAATARTTGSVEDAVLAGSSTTDLYADAQRLVLDALRGDTGREAELRASIGEVDTIVVTRDLVPGLVASLPAAVRGILALDQGATGVTSHAAILARGRGIVLAYAPEALLRTIPHGVTLLLDGSAGPSQVIVAPSETVLAEARAKVAATERAREAEESKLDTLVAGAASNVRVRVNLSSLAEAIPRGASGVGLVRTELVFAAHASAPTEDEQRSAYEEIVKRASGAPVVFRLFDAGGDKPLAWLPAPAGNPDARGMELLLANPLVLDAQLRALVAARAAGDAKVLLPLVRDAADVDAIRSRVPANALPIGAMIETPDAAAAIDPIARAADFVSIGTNDLTAFMLGVDRAEAALSFDPRVVQTISAIVERAHAAGRPITVCGEMASTERGARILAGLGVDAVSVTPSRVTSVRIVLATTPLEACREAALQAMLAAP
ncbi:MAG: phosphoenolpyruvate-protein phosphotransferase [Myxococcaceae bacterium]|nr:phosphoenolpyruvate-protein phosphotransferase [Myxococcaceae bacterium]